ncbi:hypothetical protein OTSANNIE_1189 [Anaplasma phagocytophilum str. Annie]|nr:hypothetical protein OTSANNIE_1189 [Anaplasma phagocytophilum str. Annie]
MCARRSCYVYVFHTIQEIRKSVVCTIQAQVFLYGVKDSLSPCVRVKVGEQKLT